VLKRRVPRVLVSGFLLTVAVSGLTACRTSPNVAAYVGEEQVTVTELDEAVAERLADDAIAEWAAGREDEFTRNVLSRLVEREVHAAAAERYDVQVSDADVRRRIEAVLGRQDPEAVYEQYAVSQGVTREDIFENVRQQLVRQEIAEQEGLAEPPDEAALQARYEEVREGLAEVEYGYITVPDQPAADAVLQQLTADPASYAALATQYAGPYTLPALEPSSPEDIPPPLAQGVAAAEPNTGFTTPVQEVNGVVVTFVAGTVYPTFEELRPRLEEEAVGQAAAAGEELVADVREDLGVTLNPRFELPAEGGVVDILGDEPPAEGDAGLAPPGN
jgi:peptidyl-prolyl cis-trans isomerase SurA